MFDTLHQFVDKSRRIQFQSKLSLPLLIDKLQSLLQKCATQWDGVSTTARSRGVMKIRIGLTEKTPANAGVVGKIDDASRASAKSLRVPIVKRIPTFPPVPLHPWRR